MAASAEEYYNIGMAYYDLGRYEDAERWLLRARAADRTYTASQYNLGRLAFEMGRYSEAVRYFEDVLRSDADNTIALRAAAYTRIKMGDLEAAQNHYSRLLQLVPESADDGYNHALVLHAMERYSDAEAVLERYPQSLLAKGSSLLLYARCQAAGNKIEALDSFADYLGENSVPEVRFEYAAALEYHEMYARALEEYRLSLSETAVTSPARNNIRFAIAKVLLIADENSGEGFDELESAVSGGFNNVEALEELISGGMLNAANTERLQGIANAMRRTSSAQEEENEESDDLSETDTQ